MVIPTPTLHHARSIRADLKPAAAFLRDGLTRCEDVVAAIKRHDLNDVFPRDALLAQLKKTPNQTLGFLALNVHGPFARLAWTPSLAPPQVLPQGDVPE